MNAVRRTKKKDIYVISTAQRPVPLEHFLYAGKETFKIVDSKGAFLAQGCVCMQIFLTCFREITPVTVIRMRVRLCVASR